MPFAACTPVLNPDVRLLCRRPYPGHPKGCPNFGKCDRCPPRAPLLERVLDLSKPVYAIYNCFDLGNHVQLMRVKHPDWSERQLRNCLYWQPAARAKLKFETRRFLDKMRVERQLTGLVVLNTPEACGVDVTATMRQLGVDLQWPPRTLTYQVALAGERLP